MSKQINIIITIKKTWFCQKTRNNVQQYNGKKHTTNTYVHNRIDFVLNC